MRQTLGAFPFCLPPSACCHIYRRNGPSRVQAPSLDPFGPGLVPGLGPVPGLGLGLAPVRALVRSPGPCDRAHGPARCDHAPSLAHRGT